MPKLASETLESTTLNTRTKSVRATDETRQGATNALNIPANRRVTKRRRLDEEGGSIPTAIIQQPKAADLRQEMNGKGQSRKTNMPFSRIKVDEIKFVDERLKDNTFESRKAGYNDYGARASADLAVTRGAGFRKEKNKKKRGSYRGGEITVCQTMSGGWFVAYACHSRWKVIASSSLIEANYL